MRTRLSFPNPSRVRRSKIDATQAEIGGTIGFKILSARKSAFLIKMVEDRGTNRCELLYRSHPAQAQHRTLSSSKGLVRILRAIVRPTTRFLLVVDAEFTQSCPISSHLIHRDLIGGAMSPQYLFEEFQRGFLVSRLHHKVFKHFTLVTYSAPKLEPRAGDLHENFVQVPPPVALSPVLDTSLADLGGERRHDPVAPKPYRFMADVDASFA